MVKRIAQVLLLLLWLIPVVACNHKTTRVAFERKLDIQAVLENYNVIAHGSGGFNGNTYLNSIESLNRHYESGTRIFEIDLSLSADGELVGVHYWSDVRDDQSNNKLLLDDYKTLLIKEKYHGIVFLELLEMMNNEYPDILIVIDTKDTNTKKLYSKIVEDALVVNEALLQRIIPQLYYEKMYDRLKEIYPFSNYIYTLYKTNASNDEVYRFLKHHEEITILTVSESRVKNMSDEYIESINLLGKTIFVHTINSIDVMNDYIDRGIYGVYTDFIGQDTSIIETPPYWRI